MFIFQIYNVFLSSFVKFLTLQRKRKKKRGKDEAKLGNLLYHITRAYGAYALARQEALTCNDPTQIPGAAAPMSNTIIFDI
jgi:hypothetical protein